MRVPAIQECLIRGADERAAADEGHPEAHAFFLGEPDHFNGERQAAMLQPIDDRDCQHDAEHAVERTGPHDGVEVRSEEQPRRPRWRPRVDTAQIAGVVHPTVIPHRSIHAVRCACTLRIGGERKVRVVPSGSSVCVANSRQQLTISCAVVSNITIRDTRCSRTARAAEARDSGRIGSAMPTRTTMSPRNGGSATAAPMAGR